MMSSTPLNNALAFTGTKHCEGVDSLKKQFIIFERFEYEGNGNERTRRVSTHTVFAHHKSHWTPPHEPEVSALPWSYRGPDKLFRTLLFH